MNNLNKLLYNIRIWKLAAVCIGFDYLLHSQINIKSIGTYFVLLLVHFWANIMLQINFSISNKRIFDAPCSKCIRFTFIRLIFQILFLPRNQEFESTLITQNKHQYIINSMLYICKHIYLCFMLIVFQPPSTSQCYHQCRPLDFN